MTHSFKTKLMAAAFVPALALAASTAYGGGSKSNTSANATDTTTTTTAPATTNSMQGSMKSGTVTNADATFDRLDTNHDGKLSATEAAADPKVQGAWKKLDASGKGSISKSEFQAHASDIK